MRYILFAMYVMIGVGFAVESPVAVSRYQVAVSVVVWPIALGAEIAEARFTQ